MPICVLNNGLKYSGLSINTKKQIAKGINNKNLYTNVLDAVTVLSSSLSFFLSKNSLSIKDMYCRYVSFFVL